VRRAWSRSPRVNIQLLAQPQLSGKATAARSAPPRVGDCPVGRADRTGNYSSLRSTDPGQDQRGFAGILGAFPSPDASTKSAPVRSPHRCQAAWVPSRWPPRSLGASQQGRLLLFAEPSRPSSPPSLRGPSCLPWTATRRRLR
jgi:hypothetical protein